MRLWIDVEDLLEYGRRNPRPSGIQRLAFEICRALQERYGHTGLIRFVRHQSRRSAFAVVSWQELAAVFEAMTAGVPEARPADTPPRGRAVPIMRKFVLRLPTELRVPLQDAIVLQLKTLRAWGKVAGASGRGLRQAATAFVRRRGRKAAGVAAPGAGMPAGSFAELAAPGDILLALGASWTHPDYGNLLQSERTRHGLRLAVLVYDLIPLRCPEWFDPRYRETVENWFRSVLPQCDDVFTISRAVASDLVAYARQQNLALSRHVVPIPIGTGFALPVAADGADLAKLPRPGTYVLFVSTIEVRKNHLLLFRLWRRLLDEMPREQVPTLVFVGRVATLVDDLMQQIRNSNHLDGKLVVMESASDAELNALYRGCMFTVFPSYYEGWGLPVTESLAYGKPCLVANRTSLPEAGRGLARMFDPDDLNDAYAAVRAVIEDPADLADWTAQVRRDFAPVSWTETADALLAALNVPLVHRDRFASPEPRAETVDRAMHAALP